jgi:ATP-dependent DNA helicase RecQ
VSSDVPTAAADDAQVLKAVRIVLSGVARAQERFGKGIIAQMLIGSKAAKVLRFRLDQLSTFGLLGHLKLPEVTELIDALLAAGLLDQADVERNRPVLRLTDSGNQVMRGQTSLPDSFALSVEVAARLSGSATTGSASPSHARTSEDGDREQPAADPRLEKELRQWRSRAAAENGWPPFRIMSNAVLSRLAAIQPADPLQLLAVKGIGQYFVNAYGEEVLEIIARHRSSSPEDAKRPDTSSTEHGRRESIRELSDDYQTTASARAGGTSPAAPLPARAESIARNQVKPNYYWSWRLLHEGFTADECKQIRRLDDQQLVAHLLQAIEQELPVDAAWIFAPDQLAMLDEVVGDQPPARLRPLLQQLPPEVRHEHLQLYLYCRGMSG